jgi:Family of unknown function (DUF6262)
MRPDNAAPIVAAARHRHELTRARAVQALRELDRAGAPVTFAAVAARAGVSRSWLYAQPGIRDQVVRLREATSRAPAAPVPAAQRTTEASLLRRLEAAHAERRRLQAENTRLRQEIARTGRLVARVLGEQRQASGGNPGSEPPS